MLPGGGLLLKSICLLTTELLAALEDRFTFYQMTHSHILPYFIPGPANRIAKGERSMNWVWHWNVAQGEAQKALLTDIKGRYGQGFVPEGLVKPEFVAKQKEMVAELLPEVFSKLVIDTEQPFIQPILDLSVDRMYAGRAVFV